MSKIKWSWWRPNEGKDDEGHYYIRTDCWQAEVMFYIKLFTVLAVLIGAGLLISEL